MVPRRINHQVMKLQKNYSVRRDYEGNDMVYHRRRVPLSILDRAHADHGPVISKLLAYTLAAVLIALLLAFLFLSSLCNSDKR